MFYRDLVVARLQINLTEVFPPHEFIKKVINLGNQVLVSDCDFIQRLVINTESACSIYLLYQHDWAAVCRGFLTWQCRGTLVGEEKISKYSSMALSTFFCYAERSATETLDVAVIFHLF
jgi:hypothetical protein